MTIIDFLFKLRASLGAGTSVLAQSNGCMAGRMCIIVAFVRGRSGMKCCCRHLCIKEMDMLHAKPTPAHSLFDLPSELQMVEA